ncbi:cobalamin-5'-phosphate synthase [Kushneria sinocarnis]|uniref:Adenosylcobinamide-GDP ribazoletransferase n=1 Tax=Kushneria sinocarnis TaxID=595502 RepID=A0A420WYG2_9GAMM|nr:adenosylcobinamide-GDP ribazoletransferase [Kushneria sinocarnis]RKR06262.1 cobalamin-5'-phosphate synthase [Kushneria sinocarnis]
MAVEQPQGWRRQGWLMLTALAFMTRLPVPAATPFDQESLSACQRWFPLTGVLVGGIAALGYLLGMQFWQPPVAVVVAMALTTLLTGALHEDGLADTLDGFGGGWSIEQRLSIMKDSRVGSYGVLGLGLVLLARFTLLSSTDYTVILLIVSHCLSRALAGGLMGCLPYRRQDAQDSSRIESLTGYQSNADRTVMLATVLIVAGLLLPLTLVMVLLLTLVLLGWLMRLWLMKRLGGYTGDTLGAAQQFGELLILAVSIAWFGQG